MRRSKGNEKTKGGNAKTKHYEKPKLIKYEELKKGFTIIAPYV